MNTVNPVSVPRRHDLDALRAFAMLLGIALHAALSFFPFPWAVQDTQLNDGFGIFFVAVHGFRMPLFFLVSGYFTAMLWRKRGLAALVTHRTKRILIPCLLGLVTIIPLLEMASEWGILRTYVTTKRQQPDGTHPDALFASIISGDTHSVLRELEDGTDVNIADPASGATPLIAAAVHGNVDVTKLLLERGADPNGRGRDGGTALHAAAFLGHSDVVETLIAGGAEAGTPNNEGHRPLDSARAPMDITRLIADLIGITIDEDDVRDGRSLIIPLLTKALIDDPDSSLPAAIRMGSLDAVRKRLDGGADPNEPDQQHGVTPLAWASMAGEREITELLLDRGADINGSNRDGSTALHGAAFLGRAEITELLIKRGADARATNHKRETALDSSRADREIVRFIARLLNLPFKEKTFETGQEACRVLLRSQKRNGLEKDKPALVTFLKKDMLGAYLELIYSETLQLGDKGAKSEHDDEEPFHLVATPVFHHLWFLWFLCWMVPIFAVFALLANITGWKCPPAWLMLSPVRFVWLLPLTLIPQWFMGINSLGFGPDTSVGLIPQPHILLYYGMFFGFGALYFDCDDPKGRLGRWWWIALPLALFVILPFGLESLASRDKRLLHSTIQLTYTWMMTFGMIGFFHWLLRKEIKIVRYLSDSSYWLYLTHLPLVITGQVWIREWQTPAIWKFSLLCLTVTFLLLFTYQMFVRYTPIGTLLNGPRHWPKATGKLPVANGAAGQTPE